MKFLEIINDCLLELNYKQVNSFAELVKNDHKKLKTIINIVNQEICAAHNWNFLLRHTELDISKNTQEIDNTISGRILYLLINNKELTYCENIESFITGKANNDIYSICNNKLLLPKFKTAVKAKIIYYTKNCVQAKDGTEKDTMTEADDISLIPMPFAKQLLTYGTCLRMKANPSYIRFSYWMSMYKEALANLKSRTCIDSGDTPIIKLFRQ